MKNRMIQAATGAACVGLLVGMAIAGPMKGHPNLEKARHSIEKALADCRAAKADEHNGEFGGHREKAEEALNHAKEELMAAAEFANNHK